jgi:hypothetical protein
MKSLKLSDYFAVTKPDYVYLRLIPNNSIRNNSTHKLAKTIASLYKNIFENVRKEDAKAVRVLGRDFLLGTRYSFDVPGKVAYYVVIEKKSIAFYFILPRQHLSIIKEKFGDIWSNITIEETEREKIPRLSDKATKYQLVYAKEDALSLETDRKNNDLLNSNLNVVDVLEEGDKVALYYNFLPTSQFTWRAKYDSTMRKFKERRPLDRDKTGASYLAKSAISAVINLADSLFEAITGAPEKKSQDNVSLLEAALERMNGGAKQLSRSTTNKATATVLDTQILVMSESADPLRQRNNARSLTQSFDTVAGDNRLQAKPYRKEFALEDYRVKGAEVNKVGDEEASNFFSLPGRETLERYNFIEKVNTQETQVPDELRKGYMRIGENTYRGMAQPAYLTNDKEFRYLSLILIGPNRAGKSTLIGNLGKDALDNGECVVNFDFIGNCELSDEIAELFPREKVLDIECDAGDSLQGLGYNEIRHSADPTTQYINAKRQTTQLTTLLNAVNQNSGDADKTLSPRMERYLQAAANITFISGGSIKDVFEVLSNHEVRAEFLAKVPKKQYENLDEYMTALKELDEGKDGKVSGTKLTRVDGIFDRLNKLKANPFMEMMLKIGTQNNIDLVEEMQKNQIINIRMPETMFSTDNEKDVYTTYWMTKINLALQVRKALHKGDRDKMTKVNLFIDELYQVQNTERFLTEKLSRLPKFNIKPIISCHYLNQIRHIREELRSANASYLLIAGCDKKNFRELESELYPFTERDLLDLKRYHSLNLVKTREGYARFITKLPKPVGVKETSCPS